MKPSRIAVSELVEWGDEYGEFEEDPEGKNKINFLGFIKI